VLQQITLSGWWRVAGAGKKKETTMKMKLWSTIIGSLLLSMSASYANLVYSNSFVNATGANTNLAYIGWHSNTGATATVMDANASTVGGVCPVLSSSSYVYFSPGTAGSPWLAWTENAAVSAIGGIQYVTNISMSVNNNSATEDLKFAIKVGGAWYVSQTVFNSPTVGSMVTTSVAMQSISWNSLNFVSGTTLAQGGAASLPLTGAVQAIGVFDASTTAAKGVRFDNILIQAIPEPTTISMFVFSAVGFLILSRCMR